MIRKMVDEELPPQALTSCPVCGFGPMALKSYVVSKEGTPVHNEFTYKCFNCGFGRSSPEKFL